MPRLRSSKLACVGLPYLIACIDGREFFPFLGGFIVFEKARCRLVESVVNLFGNEHLVILGDCLRVTPPIGIDHHSKAFAPWPIHTGLVCGKKKGRNNEHDV